ncbi:hypothetical protein H2198_003255 [Neophaeococcomyces mojaviensis]|uniref:Uncharacterized protein n=1 Tax=Neophaeococcomyces mojaviensis TaxID=3383035 RepID=A0ACC3AC55_9EURO|nr:hypothetical protein H2198_003255 [Knufia sp. JES_112]
MEPKHQQSGKEGTGLEKHAPQGKLAAQALAAFDDNIVSLSHLEDAVDLNKQFQSDFKGATYFDNQRSYM